MKSNTIILSVHPHYIKKIFSGIKRYEYRKKIPLNIKYIIIYATAPEKRIVALIEVDYIIQGPLEEIWEKTKKYSGINKDHYYSYYNGGKTATAIKFKNVYKLERPIVVSSFDYIKNAPQSFMYIKESINDICQLLSVDKPAI